MAKKGKKDCPQCNTELGVRTSTCSNCQYDFSSKIVEEKIEEKVEKKVEENSIVQRILQKEAKNKVIKEEEMECFTKEDHAKRILSYGIERATSLLKAHKLEKNWNHVDWKIVEQGLQEL